MNSFKDLKIAVSEVLRDDLQKDSIDLIELQGLLLILGQCEDENELRNMISVFAEDNASLRHILELEKTDIREAAEVDIQKIVSLMIKDNPTRAKELADFAVKEGATLDTIRNEFPEIDNYLSE